MAAVVDPSCYLPSVVVASCKGEGEAWELARLILGTEELPEWVQYPEGIRAYPWAIETKYYSAEAHICCLPRKSIVDQTFADGVQGVVILMDALKGKEALEEADQWMAFLKEFQAQVLILACDRCAGSSSEEEDGGRVTKLAAQQWCLQHGFELVEINPADEADGNESDEEDDFPETTGVKRIVQALHAHMWPNLVMKESRQAMSQKLQDMIRLEQADLPREEEEQPEASGGSPDEGYFRLDHEDEPSPGQSLDALIDEVVNVDADASFEELFSQFREMKMRAQSLPHEQRKEYAEKVATAFWHAIGGCEEEDGDLSEEERDRGDGDTSPTR